MITSRTASVNLWLFFLNRSVGTGESEGRDDLTVLEQRGCDARHALGERLIVVRVAALADPTKFRVELWLIPDRGGREPP